MHEQVTKELIETLTATNIKLQEKNEELGVMVQAYDNVKKKCKQLA